MDGRNCNTDNHNLKHNPRAADTYEAISNFPPWLEASPVSRYAKERANPMYRTTSMDYGRHKPMPFEVSHVFYSRSCYFSNELARFGMKMDTSFNI